MTFLIGLIAFIFMLSVIVIIHELGHLVAAKSFGVYCHEFSVGMGPALFQKKGKETTYSLRAIPLGGYVMMAGEQDGSQDEEEDDWLKEVPDDRKLNHKKVWQQVIVMVAGVTMNVILALLIFIGLSVARGYIVEPPRPIIYSVAENSPAEKAGLIEGDTIVKAAVGENSITPETNYELYEFMQFYPGEMDLEVLRDGKTIELKATPEKDEETGIYVLGYLTTAYTRPAGFFELVKDGWDTMIDSGSTIFRSLGMLLKGKGLENMSGPVGILDVTTRTAQMGMTAYLSLFALISLNIGIFNLLPIPALDGGRILIILLEKLFGRKINPKIVENIIMASFVLLIGLMLFATWNDILRFIR